MEYTYDARRKAQVFGTPVAVLGALAVAYLALTHGCESKHAVFNPGSLTSESSGSTAGDRTLFALEGQKIRVDYNLQEVKRGHFNVYIWGPRKPGDRSTLKNLALKRPKKGTIEVVAPKTGFYHVSCSPTPDGNGYDLTYEASWRVR